MKTVLLSVLIFLVKPTTYTTQECNCYPICDKLDGCAPAATTTAVIRSYSSTAGGSPCGPAGFTPTLKLSTVKITATGQG